MTRSDIWFIPLVTIFVVWWMHGVGGWRFAIVVGLIALAVMIMIAWFFNHYYKDGERNEDKK